MLVLRAAVQELEQRSTVGVEAVKAELHVHSLLLSSACWNFEPSQFLPSFLGSF